MTLNRKFDNLLNAVGLTSLEQAALVCQALGIEQANVNPLFKTSVLSCLQDK